MSSNEDYLDSLLRAAMEPPKPPSLITESMAQEESVTEPEAIMEPEETIEPETVAEPGAVSEPEETIEPETVAEPETIMEPEETIEAEAISEPEETIEPETAAEPETIMEPEETIEAEAISEPEVTGEPVAESENFEEFPAEPEIKEEIEEMAENRSLSPEEIAAMFAVPESGMTDEILDSEEADDQKQNEEAASEAISEDISSVSSGFEENKQMSQDEIEAMLAGLNDNSESAEPETETAELQDGVSEGIDTEEAESIGLNGSQQMTQEEIEAMLAGINDDSKADGTGEVPSDQEMTVDIDGVEDLDDLLGIKEMPENYKDEMRQDNENEGLDAEGKASAEPDLEDQELSDILDLLGGDDSELAEINDILKKSDNNEVVDGEGIDEMMADIGTNAEDGDSQDVEDDAKAKKKKKRLFGRKSQKSEEETDSETESAEGEGLLEGEEGGQAEKKKHIFAKLFDFLTEEAEDDPESDGESKPKKEKKGKKGKKKEKDAAESNEEILDEMAEEDEAAAKKKKKKEKKPKKQKEPKIKKVTEPELEEPVKKLPKKMIIRIFVLCFSVLFIILILNLFVPGMLSLQRARGLFYKGDYESSYKELISHDKLNDSDTILLRKAELLMHMKRKKDLYDAYEKAGLKAEGLNCLLEAAAYYNEKQEEFAVYGISYEAEQTYILISSTLTDVYGLSQDKIDEILQLDSINYTYAVNEIVYGESTGADESKPEPSNEPETEPEQDVSEQDVEEQNVPETEELEDPLEAEFD